jgi:hypothetical protein
MEFSGKPLAIAKPGSSRSMTLTICLKLHGNFERISWPGFTLPIRPWFRPGISGIRFNTLVIGGNLLDDPEFLQDQLMRLIQFELPDCGHCLGVVQGDQVENITRRDSSVTGVYSAFRMARSSGRRLEPFLNDLLDSASPSVPLRYSDLLAAGQVLPPVTEELGARLLVSGTGLTHLGSVEQRDQMHKQADPVGPKSDSRKMFELGVQGGRPAPGRRGAAPEWFYKGDGRMLRGPEQPLDIPPFAPDGGEEPEIVGIYLVDDRGVPYRLGFSQGNEWSDHVTENLGYLYLAPSKLRTCAIGPELVTDLAFDDVRGRCRVLRDGQVIYDSGELLTGERNMSHTLANLEDHHFKFPQHRQPGDLHVHFFGTSKLSFQHRNWTYQSGDRIEVAFNGLGAPLVNPVRRVEPSDTPVRVEAG